MLKRVAPVMLVRHMKASLAFWNDKVGFTTDGIWGERFAMVSRDGVTVMLVEVAPGDSPPAANWRVVDKTNQIYIWVDDARSLYEELQQRGAPIDFTLYDTPWGTREFGTQDLDDHDIAFGQVLGHAR